MGLFLVEITPYYRPFLKRRRRKNLGRFLVGIAPYYRPYLKRRRRKKIGAFFSRNYALLSTLVSVKRKTIKIENEKLDFTPIIQNILRFRTVNREKKRKNFYTMTP